jgi:O-antigen biosynthesis protein WbqP
VKRALDLVLAVFGLLVAAPVMLICLVAIRLTSPGPALLRQTRVGRYEQPFTCFKLRTMHADTRLAPSHETPATAVTPLGAWLRRLKLDELPQLWNVIRGEMSLVGPRPCLPAQKELIAARRERGSTHCAPASRVSPRWLASTCPIPNAWQLPTRPIWRRYPSCWTCA